MASKKGHDEQKQAFDVEYYAACANHQVASDREADKQILIGSGFGISLLILLIEEAENLPIFWIIALLSFTLTVILILVIFKDDGKLLRAEMDKLENDPEDIAREDLLVHIASELHQKNNRQYTWMKNIFSVGVVSTLIFLFLAAFPRISELLAFNF